MDNQNSQPQPNFEVPAQPGQVESAPNQAPETIANQELPSPSAPPPVNPVVVADPTTIAQPASDTTVTSEPPQQTSQKTSALPAEDSDLIEKEWVEKAKNIVEKTKNDPYLQNSELSKVKADYVATRFNKQIKTSEDTAV